MHTQLPMRGNRGPIRSQLSPDAPETLVCGGGHHVGVVEGGGDDPGRHQAGDVRHVGQQHGLCCVTDGAESEMNDLTG